MVAIGEAPDDESATAFALELGSAGNVRTTTLRAYDREEMSRIIERLGPSPGA
ncbi:MAG: GYD domain-containing protein, partial [Rubrobacter sp.]|nr:GYD domain-containing protein [Rubrobacter sp.]